MISRTSGHQYMALLHVLFCTSVVVGLNEFQDLSGWQQRGGSCSLNLFEFADLLLVDHPLWSQYTVSVDSVGTVAVAN